MIVPASAALPELIWSQTTFRMPPPSWHSAILEKHPLGEKIFEGVGEHLREQGLLLREGTVVDATIIRLPPPPGITRGRGSQSVLLRQGQPVVLWYEGPHWCGASLGLDPCSGHHWRQVHDVTVAAELVHGEERVVYGDAGYQGSRERRWHHERWSVTGHETRAPPSTA